MKLENIIIPTKVATPGMLVRDVFTECVRAQVPAIPFQNEKEELIGRVSIRHTLKTSCLPDYVVEMAHVLGNQSTCVDDPVGRAKEVLCHTIDEYVLPRFYSLTTETSVLKALAIMEQHNCNYVFIVDNGIYRGVVTSLAIAQRMVALEIECSTSS